MFLLSAYSILKTKTLLSARAAHCWCFVIMDAAYIFSGLSTSAVKYKIITSTSGAPPLCVVRSTWTHMGN